MSHDLLTERQTTGEPHTTGAVAEPDATRTPATGGDEAEAAPPAAVLPDPAPVLIEVAGDTGVVLWQALRDVLTWVAAHEGERAGIFGRGVERARRGSLERAALHPELSVPVELLIDVVGNPTGTKPLLVTHACLRIAQQLCRNGAGLSALVYAQAAALASPDHPRPLLEVGRLLGPACAEDARVCLLRAAEQARERNEPELCAEIHTELAALTFRRRDRRGARGHLLIAVREARAARSRGRAV